MSDDTIDDENKINEDEELPVDSHSDYKPVARGPV